MQKIGRPLSLSELAYNEIRAGILAGDFRVEQRLSVVGIADSLGMSRSPVRAAAERLATEGLLRIRQGGVEVLELSQTELLDALIVRSVLEGLAARLATPRLDRDDITQLQDLHVSFEQAVAADDILTARRVDLEFHQLIQERSGNESLMDDLRRVQARVIVTTYSLAWSAQQKHAVHEHALILQALENSDPVGAERLAIEHITRLIERVRESWSSSS